MKTGHNTVITLFFPVSSFTAEHCAEDQTETTESSSVPPTKVTTVTISTEMPTPEPMPDPGLVKAAEFNFTDDKGIVCFSLVAGLQFVVEYNTTNNNLVCVCVLSLIHI